MNVHPAALIPPPLADDDYAALKADIAANGLLHPIRTIDGQVIDGRHRYQICMELGIEPQFDPYTGPLTPLQFVIAHIRHRHMTAGQKAVMGLEIEKYEAALARERMLAGKPANPSVNLRQGEPGKASEKAAAATGASARNVQAAKKLAQEAPDLLEKVKAGAVPIHAATRELKEREREAKREDNRTVIAASPEPEKITGVYSTIVIDPPWDWGDEGDQDQLGRARPTYGTMSIDALLALPVGEYAAPDAHLYLWITNRSLPKGFALLERWGFRYITCVTWAKPSFGMGNYFRGQTEQVLFGVRGSLPLNRKDASTLFTAPRGPRGHSSKPAEFYGFVESCSPGPYLEMFARGGRKDWTSWGAEADAA